MTAVSFETTTLIIPSMLGGNAVTGFNADVFAGKTRAVRVTIPSSISAIPANAFLGCTNLRAVTINGQGLLSIGNFAFKNCGNLQSFVIPDSVTSLGRGTFSGCESLESITIGDGIQSLTGVPYDTGSGYYGDYTDRTTLYYNYDDGLFYNCTSLKTINWGANVKTIGNVAFLNCSALDRVTIPASVSEIGCHAFYGCSSMRTVIVLGSISSIGRRAFANCPALRYVDFQGAVMTDAPGEGVFAFDNASVTAYAAAGSTGWKGVAEVTGFPSSGVWSGARIAYGPAPEIPDDVTVTLNRQSGSGGTASVIGAYGLAMPAITIPTRTGYTFGGYWTASNGGGTQYYTATGASARNWDKTTATTLYAKWTAKTATVWLNRQSGSGGTASATATYGAAMPAITVPKRTGYTFGGYYTAMGGAGTQYYAASGASARNWDRVNAITLYAKWTPTKFRVAFSANGGTLPKGKSMNEQIFTYDKAAALRKNLFTRSGYVFIGWAKSKTGAVAYANGAIVKNLRTDGKTMRLYAVWAKAKYKVAFYANGGTGKMAAQAFTYGKAAKLAANKFKAPKGKKFAGWATSAANAKKGKVTYKNKQAVKNLVANGKTVKLYAVWKR